MERNRFTFAGQSMLPISAGNLIRGVRGFDSRRCLSQNHTSLRSLATINPNVRLLPQRVALDLKYAGVALTFEDFLAFANPQYPTTNIALVKVFALTEISRGRYSVQIETVGAQIRVG